MGNKENMKDERCVRGIFPEGVVLLSVDFFIHDVIEDQPTIGIVNLEEQRRFDEVSWAASWKADRC